MKINKAWCFFEQSGVFKNEFKKLGIPAVDCDILNNFNQTDFELDLFREIEKAHSCEDSIFEDIKKDDLIFAFFPCTYFSARVPLNSRGEAVKMKSWGDRKKLIYTKFVINEISVYYRILCDLCLVCLTKNLKLVIENPYTQPHFLTQYFPIKPVILDKDRSKRGDDFKKPTQYFFINCEPEQNFIFENIEKQRTKIIEKMRNKGEICRQELRSLINPCYANRFIREFLLDGTNENK